MFTGDDLLDGPRGRRLCFAVACELDDRAWAAALHTARTPSDPDLRAGLVDVLGDLDPSAVRGRTDPLSFLAAVGRTVDASMGWQEPDLEDIALAEPAVARALRPVAEAIAAAPASRWWQEDVDLAALRVTEWVDPERPSATDGRDPADRLARWRVDTLADERRAAADRPRDPAAPYSGHWWSTPALASLLTTTRPLPGLGALTLVWEEDGLGLERAQIRTYRTKHAPTVWEVHSPADWVRLVDRYPLAVTAARRHDWYRVTGLDAPWSIPDWADVARDWDAVHISVAGYLTTATRALPLTDGRGWTLLAGADPDQTWWLTGALALVEAMPTLWVWDDDADRWRRE